MACKLLISIGLTGFPSTNWAQNNRSGGGEAGTTSHQRWCGCWQNSLCVLVSWNALFWKKKSNHPNAAIIACPLWLSACRSYNIGWIYSYLNWKNQPIIESHVCLILQLPTVLGHCLNLCVSTTPRKPWLRAPFASSRSRTWMHLPMLMMRWRNLQSRRSPRKRSKRSTSHWRNKPRSHCLNMPAMIM